MKTKTIPFDLEMAKKIQAGEIEGKIKTKCGYAARILCTDLMGQAQPVLAAFNTGKSESESHYTKIGCFYIDGEFSDLDLVLEVPDTEPQFKLGDKVRVKPNSAHSFFVRQYENSIGKIVRINLELFVVLVTGAFQDEFTADELEFVEEAKDHEFQHFDKVLVRDDDNFAWCLALYAYFQEETALHRMVGGACWGQCIPYEGNEHLLGTTDKPKEE